MIWLFIKWKLATDIILSKSSLYRHNLEPRIPTLLQILGVSKKKITEISPQKLEVEIETLSTLAVEMKRKEVILKDVEILAKE